MLQLENKENIKFPISIKQVGTQFFMWKSIMHDMPMAQGPLFKNPWAKQELSVV